MTFQDEEQEMEPQRNTGPQGQAGASSNTPSEDSIIIKKYANRRLYNTATSSYVTLDHLAEMVRNGDEFHVVDAKTGDDLTRTVLTQIIFEQENKGQNLLPVSFLRHLIGLYGDNLQSFVPSYLEMSMEAFRKNQETMRRSMSEAFSSPHSGLRIFEDAARKNMAFFEQGLKMFGLPTPSYEAGSPEAGENEVLRAEVERLRAELAKKG